MDRSAQQWLEWITSRADSEKPRVSRLRAYASSKPPMPDMGPRLKKSWLRFQDRARTNFAGLIVDSLVNRIQPNGIVIGETLTLLSLVKLAGFGEITAWTWQ